MESTGGYEAQQTENQNEIPHVIAVFRQLLDRADPLTTSKYSIIQTLCDEVGEDIDLYSDQILEELDEYVHKNQKGKQRENPSLDTIYIVSNELQAITIKGECSGREVILEAVWKYISEHKLIDSTNPELINADSVFKTIIKEETVSIYDVIDCINMHISLPERSQTVSEQLGKKIAFTKPMKLSEELSAFVGQSEMSRPQLIKFFWKYFKANNLQDPANKRVILCDEKLKSLLGQETFQAFSLMKYLKKHIISN